MTRATILHGDCLAVLPTLAADSMDACVTDPPYHLTSIVKRFGSKKAAPAKVGATGAYARASRGFMGKTWDGGDVAFRPETWTAVARVLKPGAHLLAFGGTRTYHRLACAVEDAGFEIRDCIAWTYGQGFPKSHNLDGGLGTALKPALEPIVVARKPLSERTVEANVARWGTGAINIGACRVATDEDLNGGAYTEGRRPRAMAPGGDARSATTGNFVQPAGRWPANLIHDGSQGVLELFPETISNGTGNGGIRGMGYHGGAEGAFVAPRPTDRGSAARFFYCAKATSSDRAGSNHPTVKPRALMRYLCRLVTPPGGTVLDPFAGSGTTLYAARDEGFGAVGIELDPEYFAFVEARLGRRLKAAE